MGNYSAIIADILMAYGPLCKVSERVSKVITLAGRGVTNIPISSRIS